MHGNTFNISSFVNDLIPEHIVFANPELVEFIKLYALYLEKTNLSAYYLNQLDLQRDIDLIETELLTELQNEIGTPIPRSFAADPRLFYKHLVDFYISRGTPESIKSFFRLIYDDDVEIYFPKDDMLIPSDGKWYDQSAKIKENPSNYTPSYTWDTSLTSDVTVIGFADDGGFLPIFDGDIITVATVITAGSFVSGTKYKIIVLTGTSQAQWNIAAGTNGITYEVDDTFTAADVGEGDGTVIAVNGDYEPGVTLTIEQAVSDGETYNLHKITFLDRTITSSDVVKSYRPGLFTVTDSFPSDKKFIQDSLFYQKFSYVLKTGRNIKDWKDAFIRLIHPSGFKFFGEILINIEMLIQRSGDQPGYQIEGLPFSINIGAVYLSLLASESGTFVEKTWTIPTSGYDGIRYENQPIGIWDHFRNIQFQNWRPISDYSNFTIEDVINKNIGTQIGCQIIQCDNADVSWNGDIPYTTTNNIDYIVDGTDTGTDTTYYEIDCPVIT